jgi:predicted DNA-binding protein (MmcQ/YjbR family)
MADRSVNHRVVQAVLSLPGAHGDFPWGERVAKVGKKIFAFFGADGPKEGGMAVKLPDSCGFALSFDSVTPTSHGLARARWVSIDFGHPNCPSIDLLLDWLDESYRAVAPKRLVAELDRTEDTGPRSTR